MPVKSCKWCLIEKDTEAFPSRSAACGPCKAHWEGIWRSVTSIYVKEGYQWLRQSQLQVHVFKNYKGFVEAGGRGRDYKWCDFIPDVYKKSNEAVDFLVAAPPVATAPVAASPAATAPAAESPAAAVEIPHTVTSSMSVSRSVRRRV